LLPAPNFSEHFLVGVTDRDRSGQLEPQVFVMDMNTGRANSFAKVRLFEDKPNINLCNISHQGLENAHAVALGTNGDIYVSQMEPAQIVKFSMGANNNNEQREQQELGAN
jgi:hypothetical protein